jgi:hypothetical protein
MGYMSGEKSAAKPNALIGTCFVVAVIAIGVALAGYRHFSRQPSGPEAVDASAQARKVVSRTASAPLRESAARAVRGEPPEPLNPMQKRPFVRTADKPVVVQTPNSTLSSSQEAPAPKTPQELIAHFTIDDPTKVFVADSVRYHDAVSAEPVDHDWGPIAEHQIATFMSNQLRPNVEYVWADCRTDLCELNVVSPSTGSAHDFSEALSKMELEPWWTTLQFDQESGSMTFEDGRFVAVYFFSRK